MSNSKLLTKAVLDRTTPKDKRFVIWDSALAGFGVRVNPNGTKVFFIRYRPNGGGRNQASKDYTIGKYGIFTPEQARDVAHHELAGVRLGANPQAEKQEQRVAETFSDLVDHYLGEYALTKQLRPATLRMAQQVFRAHALPALGKKAIKDIRQADIARLHAATHKASGRYIANRTLAFVRSAFSIAVRAQTIAINPAIGIAKYPEDAREAYLTTNQAAAFFSALEAMPDQRAADAFRLLIYTGARLGEVLGARFDQFDLEQAVWIKPSAHTKTKRQHKLMLNQMARDVVARRRKDDPFGVFLFVGKDGTKPRVDLKGPWAWLKKAANLDGLSIHSLRHSHASFLISAGAPLAVVGKQLGHTQSSTTQRYAHIADEAQRAAMALLEAKFSGLGAGGAKIHTVASQSHKGGKNV